VNSDAPDERGHTVAFHASDADLVHGLTEYVADGLLSGDAVVVVATPDHCARLAADLSADLPLAHFVDDGRYRDVDALATLRSIRTDDGRIDGEVFDRLIGSVVATAAASGRRVRIVGDLVGLVWDEGDVVGALDVERLWNDLLGRTAVVLNCTYPTDGSDGDLGSLCGICACHTAVDLSADLPDDVADGDAGETVSRLYVPHPGAAVQARRQVHEALHAWQCDAIADDAVLLVSEIATNAVLHAGTPFRLTVARRPGIVRIAVTDGADTLPVRRHPAPDEPGGRGMALVEMLTVAHGADRVDGGKVVWAELAV